MKKDNILIALGILVAILPALGFPSSWDNFLFVFSGLTIAYIVWSNRKYSLNDRKIKSDIFIENKEMLDLKQKENHDE